MIACIAPNPALDRTLGIARLVPGGVARTRWEREVAGGKALNVARVLRVLGASATVVGPIGGDPGRRLARLAETEGLVARWSSAEHDTRTCTILVEDDGRSTVVNEPGRALSDAEWSSFIELVRDVMAGTSVVSISGSMPGDDAAHVADLVRAAGPDVRAVWIDAAGAALGASVGVPGVSIKVNRDEAAALVGDVDAVAAACRLLDASSAHAVIVTDGASGAVHADRIGVWRCAPPLVSVVSPTGCGDAALAALVAAHGARRGVVEALRYSVAVGAAAATMSIATVERPTVDRLLALTPAPEQVDRRTS